MKKSNGQGSERKNFTAVKNVEKSEISRCGKVDKSASNYVVICKFTVVGAQILANNFQIASTSECFRALPRVFFSENCSFSIQIIMVDRQIEIHIIVGILSGSVCSRAILSHMFI